MMSRHRIPQLEPTIFVTALATACANPKRIDEAPIAVMHNGDRVASPTHTTDAATTVALEVGIAGRQRRDSLTAAALASCAAPVCAALERGELPIGLAEEQGLAATRTPAPAWWVRRSGHGAVVVPRGPAAGPRGPTAP